MADGYSNSNLIRGVIAKKESQLNGTAAAPTWTVGK
jgi:hypothetical protein